MRHLLLDESDPATRRYRQALAALFLSGAAGLVHEIVWAKLLARLIGSTAHAQALVLALFMGGLAIGAVLFGRSTPVGAAGLRLYARLELLIGAYGVALPLFAMAVAALHDAAAPFVFGRPALAFALRFVLAGLIALPPAIWMGGTLPVLAACLTRTAAETRSRVGSLYAVNNLGAVLGALLAGFVLLGAFGTLGALFAAAALNFASAALGFRLARLAAEPSGPAEATPVAAATLPLEEVSRGEARAALLVLALSGYAAMGYEAVFSRIIALAFGGTTYSFTVMLAAFITGIGVGSALVGRLRVRRTLELLATLQLTVGAAFLAVTPALARLPYWIGLLRADLQGVPFGFELHQAGKAALCLLVLLVPTACLGAGFPLVAALSVRTVQAVGSTVGRVYAWNTAGNVLGVLLTGLLVLPVAGLGAAFGSCVAVSFLAGGIGLVAAKGPVLRRALPALAAALVLALHLGFGGGWLSPLQKSVDHLRLRSRSFHPQGASWLEPPASSFAAWKAAYVQDLSRAPRSFFDEDANATVLALGDESSALLAVNTKPDASVRLVGSDMSTQQLTGHLPALLARERGKALVIGYGSGVTAGALLQHPFERVDVVEISSAVLGAHEIFAPFNHDALSDPRVEVFEEDGRSFLRTVPRSYDLITSEPSNPWLAGIGALFTLEFFRDAATRLRPGGVFCAWMHQYEQDEAALELVLRTLNGVFPSVSVHRATPTGSDLVLIARNELEEPDFALLERRFDEPRVHADLERIGAFNLASLLIGQVASPERLPRLLGAGPVNRELHERLEYLAPEPVFRGSEATWARRHDGLVRRRMEATFTWIERYIAWRDALGDPVGREELSVAVAFSGEDLPPRHEVRLALRELLAERAALAPRGEPRPSRRALPPVEHLGFELAFQVGARLHRLGDGRGALAYYQRAFELRPEDPNLCWNLAKVLAALGRREEEARVLATGLEHAPQSVELSRALGRSLIALDRLAEARRLLEELSARVSDPAALTSLGELDEREGLRGRAAERYARALEVSGNSHAPAAERLASLLASSGRLDEARAVLTRALAVTPGQPRLLELAAELDSRSR